MKLFITNLSYVVLMKNSVLRFWRKKSICDFLAEKLDFAIFSEFGRKTWFCGFGEKTNFGSWQKTHFLVLAENLNFWFYRKRWLYDFGGKTQLCGFGSKQDFVLGGGSNFMFLAKILLFGCSRKIWFFRFGQIIDLAVLARKWFCDFRRKIWYLKEKITQLLWKSWVFTRITYIF